MCETLTFLVGKTCIVVDRTKMRQLSSHDVRNLSNVHDVLNKLLKAKIAFVSHFFCFHFILEARNVSGFLLERQCVFIGFQSIFEMPTAPMM